MQEYEAQMDEYKTTENYRRYQNYLKSFQHDQSHGRKTRSGAKPALDQDRKSRSNSSETLSVGSGEVISRSTSGSLHTDECRAAFDLAMQELFVRRDEVLALGAPIFDARNLPPKDTTYKAAMSCRLGTGSFVFLIRQELLETMLDHVYSGENVDSLSLIVVLLVAAVGAHYDAECMSDTMRHGLFASASLIFESEFSGLMDYRAMWVFAILSLHSLLEKHMVARHVVTAGLQISRLRGQIMDNFESESLNSDDVKRLVCTLVFMECWLSTTLGYKADIRAEDVTRAFSLHETSNDVADAIYYQATKIGLVAKEIAEITVHKTANAVRTEHIELLTERLDAWYKLLPANMHLAALTDEKQFAYLTYYQRRAILMVHMFYLGAIINLYRQLLLQACQARIQSKWNLDMPYSQIQNYRTRCSIAAQQMARMIPLISFSGAMTRRCWVMIYWAFHSCTVILFGIAQQMLDQRPATIDEDFAFAKVCVDTLSACSTAEPVAANYLGLIQPLHDALVDKHKRLKYQAATAANTPVQQGLLMPSSHFSPPQTVQLDLQSTASIDTPSLNHSVSEKLDSEIVSISRKLSELLTDPFSMGIKAKIQGVRESSNAVGTYSVLWWK
ncbi:hypothetical protein MPH_10859 [Macrophomina phaseolina MS6]|uniref:Transcription factor fungi n=1 Tax=Macrophomina phaseolina (strain MS6) TaxID=1126212 RepID=K2RP59_MACPH|nr:hypothetical protein MPH_10859 [Macrophomina phaseolina MS6]